MNNFINELFQKSLALTRAPPLSSDSSYAPASIRVIVLLSIVQVFHGMLLVQWVPPIALYQYHHLWRGLTIVTSVSGRLISSRIF